MISLQRRDFIKTSLFGGMAAASMPAFAMSAWDLQTKQALTTTPKVSLTTGDSRAQMVFDALKPFSKEIAQAIGNKRVVLKPNMVSSSIQLSATHVETLEGVLEFLKSIKKLNKNCIITESAADGPSLNAFENFKMMSLETKYNVKIVDMDAFDPEIFWAIDESDFRPHPVRMSSVMTDPNNFIISCARMKTHDRVICTLSLKNLVLGAPIKEAGTGGRRGRSDKPVMHGGGYKGINFNLFSAAYKIHPDLAIVDGYDGMEGNGPTQGTKVDHRVCLAGLDWVATDSIGYKLMGVDYKDVGYLNFCADAGMGQIDPDKIQVIGERVEDHIIKYKMSGSYERQLSWKTPLT